VLSWARFDLPACVSQLSALHQLDVRRATPTALHKLQMLTGLTQLCVREVIGLSPESPPLKLPGLQQLESRGGLFLTMPVSFLASCTQLQFLKLTTFRLQGPGSLVASTMLQDLELNNCSIPAADGAADPVSWQLVFPGPGQLPHLTSLQLFGEQPALQQADMDCLVACCGNLKVLGLDLRDDFPPALMRLPGLTNLHLRRARAEDFGTLAQLTGLRQLRFTDSYQMSAVGLRQLAALDQLTSLGLGSICNSKLKTLAAHLMSDYLPGCLHAINNKVCTIAVWLWQCWSSHVGGGACIYLCCWGARSLQGSRLKLLSTSYLTRPQAAHHRLS